jgi:hypothetical protein
MRSRAQVSGRPIAGMASLSPTEGMDVSVLWVLCVVKEVAFATGWSLVQRNPTGLVSNCVWSRILNNEAA